MVGVIGIGGEGKVCGDNTEANAGAFFGRDEERIASNFSKTGVSCNERGNDLIVAHRHERELDSQGCE